MSRSQVVDDAPVGLRQVSAMRAAVLRGPGDVVIEERPVPEPGPGEVVVRISSSGPACGRIAASIAAIRQRATGIPNGSNTVVSIEPGSAANFRNPGDPITPNFFAGV